jgi:hypothetical protein
VCVGFEATMWTTSSFFMVQHILYLQNLEVDLITSIGLNVFWSLETIHIVVTTCPTITKVMSHVTLLVSSPYMWWYTSRVSWRVCRGVGIGVGDGYQMTFTMFVGAIAP